MASAPVRILGWDDENECWAAYREGEPSFTGVQNLGDAYLACSNREAQLLVSDDVYGDMVRAGDAPPDRPVWAHD